MLLAHTCSLCLLVREELEQARKLALLRPPHKWPLKGLLWGIKDISWKTANWEGLGLEKQNVLQECCTWKAKCATKSAVAGLPRLWEAFSISWNSKKNENNTEQMRARGLGQKKLLTKPGQQVPPSNRCLHLITHQNPAVKTPLGFLYGPLARAGTGCTKPDSEQAQGPQEYKSDHKNLFHCVFPTCTFS